jgi:hypothetical protein
LYSIEVSHKHSYGTLHVQKSAAEEMTFEDACEAVKDLTQQQWSSVIAAAELARHRKTMTPLQEVLVVVKTHVHAFLDAGWRATACIHRDNDNGEFVDYDDLPRSVREAKGRYWDAVNQNFVEVTLDDKIFGAASLEGSILLAGPPGVQKSSLLHTICRVFMRMLGSSFYLCTASCDDYGSLSHKGLTALAGACGFDDADLSTGNGRGLTVDEIKNLFQVRFASSYSARYYPATFAAGVPKVFACNLNVDTAPPRNDSIASLPWVGCAARNDVETMQGLSQDLQAQARRCTVFHFTSEILRSEHAVAKFKASDEAVLKARMARLDEWRQQKKK